MSASAMSRPRDSLVERPQQTGCGHSGRHRGWLTPANCGLMHRNKTASLDHLVGSGGQTGRHVEAELLRGLAVDHQLVLDRRLHRKVARLRTLEDEIDIDRRARKIIGQVNSVGQEAAEFSEETVRIDGRKMVASRQRCDLYAMSIREAIRHHDKATIRLACLCGND